MSKRVGRISKLETIDETTTAYDSNGNVHKLSRSQRTELERYDYSSINNHSSFQEDIRWKVGNGKHMIADQFVYIKKGRIFYENT